MSSPAGSLRVGVVGVGHAHGPMWAKALLENEHCSWVGIYDHDADRGRAVAASVGCDFEPDLERFLHARKLDAVAITSEHGLHRQHVEAAAQAGLAILCEKPLATTLDDAFAAADAVLKHRVRFMQGFQMRLDPANAEVKRLVESGALGTISSVMKRHSHYFGLFGWPDDSGGWFYDRKMSGGGAGLDEMVHTCDWLRWLFGEPESVTAMTSSQRTGSEVEDHITAVFRMRSGVIATLISSWTEVSGAVTTQIAGDRGSVLELYTDLASTRCGRPFQGSVLVQREPDLAWTPLGVEHSFPNVHAAVANEFIRCLRTDAEFPSTLDDGFASLAMVLAAYQSAEQGRVVPLNDRHLQVGVKIEQPVGASR